MGRVMVWISPYFLITLLQIAARFMGGRDSGFLDIQNAVLC